jgi:SEC-C motif
MSYPRNQPCVCGSGKKYKHCHLGKPFRPEADISVQHRNRITLAAAIEIFGFRKGRTWTDFKQNISGDQIRRFYEIQAEMWRPDTDWAAIMPAPDSKLRGLYLGDIRPELTLRNLVRFSLYTDQLFIINPFHNPWVLQAQYNPIENPDQYKSDTLNLMHFLFSVAPWIEAGILTLIPDPGEINVALKWETARLAKARIGDQEPDERDLEEASEHGRQALLRALLALPEKQFYQQLDQMGEDTGKIYTDEEKREFFKVAKAKLRSDPIAWEGPPGQDHRSGQMIPFRSGANLT